MNKLPIFLILVGPPGCGKTTFIKKYLKNEDEKIDLFEVVSLDEIRKEINGDINDINNDEEVKRTAKARTIFYLENGKNVVLDAVSCSSKTRRNWINFLKSHLIKFNPMAIDMGKECTVDLSIKRVSSDIEKGLDRSNVPNFAIKNIWASYLRDLDKIESDGYVLIHKDYFTNPYF